MSRVALNTVITFSDEQSMLLDTATEFFSDNSPIETVRANLETETGFDHEHWRQMVELGWLGLAVPEEYGGSGLGLAEAVVIAEPMGRKLFACPFQSTQLAIQGLMQGNGAQKSAWLPGIAQGKMATVALFEQDGDWNLLNPTCQGKKQGDAVVLSGVKTLVTDAAVAELVLVSIMYEGAPAIGLAPKVEQISREVIIDETRRSYRLDLQGIEIPFENLITGAAAIKALEGIRNAALLLISAEACGGIAGTLDVLVEYLNTRTQFGRKIGSFQALKHPTVDMLIGMERARSHVYHAASVLDDEKQLEAALRMAKIEAGETFAFAGDRAIQFHGGFGFTYECDAQLFLRRALWCQYAFGDALHHRKRLAELLI